MTSLITQLKAAAKLATPGPWSVQKSVISGASVWAKYSATGEMMVCANGYAGFDFDNADHIAACSPENILALCELAEAAKELAEKIKTLSVRANTFGPGMPDTYADATWRLGEKARAFLAKYFPKGE